MHIAIQSQNQTWVPGEIIEIEIIPVEIKKRPMTLIEKVVEYLFPVFVHSGQSVSAKLKILLNGDYNPVVPGDMLMGSDSSPWICAECTNKTIELNFAGRSLSIKDLSALTIYSHAKQEFG